MGEGEGREENGLAFATQAHARQGTNPARSAAALERCDSPSFDKALECPGGMRAGFAKGTARIRGIGAS